MNFSTVRQTRFTAPIVWMMIAAATAFVSSAAMALNLSEYLTEIKSSDPTVMSLEQQLSAAQALQEKSKLPTQVQFFTSLSYLDDQRPTQNPAFQGYKTENNSLAVGLKQQTDFGLQWTLSQNLSKTRILGASPTTIPLPEYYDSYPKLELNLNLWRNFGGRQVTAEIESLDKKLEADRLQAEVKLISRMMEAEQIYWQLAWGKESARIAAENETRARKLYKWSSQRRARGLADVSDLYQAESAVKLRELEGLNIETMLQEYGRKFNLARGKVSDVVTEKVDFEKLDLRSLIISNSGEKRRKDLRLAQLGQEARIQVATSEREKLKPSLDLMAQVSAVGRDREQDEATRKTFTSGNDYYLVGLIFTIPLNYGVSRRIMGAHEQELESARFEKERLELQQIDSYQTTVSQLSQIKKQLEVLRELEVSQKKKLAAEEQRYNVGRSTTFQVLSFEQDYVNAVAKRLELELRARVLLSTLQIYE